MVVLSDPCNRVQYADGLPSLCKKVTKAIRIKNADRTFFRACKMTGGLRTKVSLCDIGVEEKGFFSLMIVTFQLLLQVSISAYMSTFMFFM